jgi:hypothetical protein
VRSPRLSILFCYQNFFKYIYLQINLWGKNLYESCRQKSFKKENLKPNIQGQKFEMKKIWKNSETKTCIQKFGEKNYETKIRDSG